MKENIILLHGALGSKSNLQELSDLLQVNFNVHSFNFRGHGGLSFPKNEMTMSGLAEEIGEFIENNAIYQPSIFGYSMGGYAALKYASKNHKRVKNIITLGTKFDWSPSSTQNSIEVMNLKQWKEKNPTFVEVLKQLHQPTDIQILITVTQNMLCHLSKSDFLSDEELHSIQCPVHLMLGDQDKMVSVEESEIISSKIPKSNLIFLKDTKHPIELVNKILLSNHLNEILNAN